MTILFNEACFVSWKNHVVELCIDACGCYPVLEVEEWLLVYRMNMNKQETARYLARMIA